MRRFTRTEEALATVLAALIIITFAVVAFISIVGMLVELLPDYSQRSKR